MDNFDSGKILTTYNRMVSAREIVFDELQVSILRELEKYNSRSRKWWERWRSNAGALHKRGVYLYGEVGRGKSLLTGIFYEYCAIERKYRTHFNDFMKRIHDLLQDARLSGESQNHVAYVVEAMVKDIDLLYIDEVQVHDICEAMVLKGVFSALFSRNLKIFMTSNYHPRKLYEDGIHRDRFLPAIDLIEEKMEVLEMPGADDYRRAKSVKSGCTFYTGENADQILRDHFLKQVNFQDTKKVVLTVQGRKFEIGEECNGVAWFNFNELCGNTNPLWTLEYVKIAETFPEIFIQGIPLFDAYLQNEVQRFIVLIDTLYEHKSRLFCSIATDICNLYMGKMTHDVKRALSRLYEMGSNMWKVE